MNPPPVVSKRVYSSNANVCTCIRRIASDANYNYNYIYNNNYKNKNKKKNKINYIIKKVRSAALVRVFITDLT